MLALPVFSGEKLPIQNNNGIIQPDSRHVRLPPWPSTRPKVSLGDSTRPSHCHGRQIVNCKIIQYERVPAGTKVCRRFCLFTYAEGENCGSAHFICSVYRYLSRLSKKLLRTSFLESVAVLGEKKWWSWINDPLTGVLTEREFLKKRREWKNK